MRFHRFWQVLFISEYQDDGVSHLPVVDDPVQLLPGLVYPVPVGAVHHEYKALGAGVVMAPQRTDLILTSDIPHVKFNILVGDGLDVEADCGDGIDALAQLELVEDRGLARGVQPEHQNPHLLVPEHLGEDLPHDEARDQGAGGGEGSAALIEN